MECKEEYNVGESYYHIGTITAIDKDYCGECDHPKCKGALVTESHTDVCGYLKGKKVWIEVNKNEP